jgi:hypothetical protein
MKRFLMLVGVAAVAGAMYVAAAPGSRQASPPTARQFAALKKQVASLSTKLKALTKDEKAVKTAAVAAVEYIGACFLDSNGNIENLQVNDFGTTTTGFLFGTTTGSTPRSALDVNVAGTTPLAYLQEVTPACVTGTSAASPAQKSLARVHLWAESLR